MTTGRKPTKSGKGAVKKLKLKKQTLKDLGALGKSVKGGWVGLTRNGCGPGSGA